MPSLRKYSTAHHITFTLNSKIINLSKIFVTIYCNKLVLKCLSIFADDFQKNRKPLENGILRLFIFYAKYVTGKLKRVLIQLTWQLNKNQKIHQFWILLIFSSKSANLCKNNCKKFTTKIWVERNVERMRGGI